MSYEWVMLHIQHNTLQSYVWHDSFVTHSWLIPRCCVVSYEWVVLHIQMRHCAHMNHDAFVRHNTTPWNDSVQYVKWLVNMRGITNSFVCTDAFTWVTWRIRTTQCNTLTEGGEGYLTNADSLKPLNNFLKRTFVSILGGPEGRFEFESNDSEISPPKLYKKCCCVK